MKGRASARVQPCARDGSCLRCGVAVADGGLEASRGGAHAKGRGECGE
jgi:hypothetical protein